MDVVLRGDRVLIAGRVVPASVAIADGAIAAIGGRDADHDAAQTVDLPESAVLLPGFVDSHVHINEPGTNWEGFETATAAAAAAGITTLIDMPLDCDPVTTSVEAVAVKLAAAQGQCTVDVRLWAGVTPDNLGRLADLAAAGVAGFKCFLADSGNPNFGHLAPNEFRAAMAEIADLDSILLVHAELQDVITAAPAPHGRNYGAFLASRPDAAEYDAVELVIDVARDTAARAHVVHVSSAQVLPLLAHAKHAGVPVTAETCPHYLTFAAESIDPGRTELLACPPIRSADNRERLWAALLDGTIDMVVSDHSPCSPDLKGPSGLNGDGDVGDAFAGISSLQLGPRVMWTHAQARGFGAAELAEWMSARPAALAGLTDRGRIDVGTRADLCVFDTETTAPVRAESLLHRHSTSAYDGVRVRGRALQTWVAGRCVHDAAGASACR